MRIVDTHHHLWDLDALPYPWLTDKIEPKPYGDYSAIRKNYLIEDYLADIDTVGITKSVHLAAVSDDLRETAWLDAIAEDVGRSRGYPHAIVAGADLVSPDIEQNLDKQAAYPRVRGIRQILSGVVTAGHPDVSQHPAWSESVGRLARRDMSLDLQLHPTQLSLATALARDNPELLLIIDHCALVNYRDPELLDVWRRGIASVSALPNVRMKISALMMFDLNFTAESIRPVVHEIIEAFGVERSFFASNFPVDRLAGSYAQLWERYLAAISEFSADEKDQLLYRSAVAAYRLGDR